MQVDRMKNKIISVSILVIFSVLIAGCVGQAQQSTQNQTTNISSTESGSTQNKTTYTIIPISLDHSSGYISVVPLKTKLGYTVRFEATSNQPSHRHGITIDEFNVNQEVTAGPGDNPTIIEFVASQRGSFKIYCKTCLNGPFGAHPQMTATLVVE